MAISRLKGDTVEALLWTDINTVESQALDQLRNIASLPWVAHVAVMPDVHFGKGATVGSVIGMRGAVSPAAVGVDIGCGVSTLCTNLRASELPNDLHKFRLAVEESIPTGFSWHQKIPSLKHNFKLGADREKLFEEFSQLDQKVQSENSKALLQLGSLGGGNHFLECCLDESTPEPNVWLLLHSGSRNIGKTLADIHISRAMKLSHNNSLPDHELAVFLAGTPEMQAYRHDLYWAQRYAALNRKIMMDRFFGVLKSLVPQAEKVNEINCHHNYVAEEMHFGEELIVTRKGAISAKKGEMGIIPGSMGTCSYIVEGLGNEEALTSASHGAGRRMSRNKAKKAFTIEDLKEQTKGVECSKDVGVLDEIPGAYKDIDKVMAQQESLVKITAKLKQILCVKGY